MAVNMLPLLVANRKKCNKNVDTAQQRLFGGGGIQVEKVTFIHFDLVSAWGLRSSDVLTFSLNYDFL